MAAACEDTRVVKKLSPFQPGALKLAQRYGSALVCVRYRQDRLGLRRYTTVELVVDEAPVNAKRANAAPVGVKIGLTELHLQRLARTHGARWDRAAKVWRMPRGTAILLGLKDRITEN